MYTAYQSSLDTLLCLWNPNIFCLQNYKQGFLEATVEFALRKEDLREEFLKYLIKVVEKETESASFGEAAVTKDN